MVFFNTAKLQIEIQTVNQFCICFYELVVLSPKFVRCCRIINVSICETD